MIVQNSSYRRIRNGLTVLATVSLLTACSPTIENQGNLPDNERLSEIIEGQSTKTEIQDLLGPPSTVGTFRDKNWYYIARKVERQSFLNPDVVEQQILVVSFDDQDVVISVDRYDLTASQEIKPVGRTTPSHGHDMTFMQQLLGNVGRFSKAAPKR